MKIIISEKLLNLDGTPILEGEKPSLLKDILIMALARGLKQGEAVSEPDLVKRRLLAESLFKSEEVDLASEDIVLLKGLVKNLVQNINLNPLIAGKVIDLLEPKSAVGS